MRSTKRIQTILQDYFSLIRSALAPDEYKAFQTLRGQDLIRFVAEESHSPGVLYTASDARPRFDLLASGLSVSRVPTRNAFEVRLDTLIREVGAYWDGCASQLLEALIEDLGYSLVLPMRGRLSLDLAGSVRRLAIYFDTLILVDPLHIPADRREEVLTSEEFPGLRLTLAQRLGYILALEPLLSYSTEKNIFVVIPDFIGSDYDIDLQMRFLGELFGSQPTAEEVNRYLGYCAGIIPASAAPLPIRDSTLWSNLLDRFRPAFEGGTTGLSLSKDTSSTRASIHTFTRDMREWPVEKALGQLIYDVGDSFYILRETVGNATLLGSDPIIYQPDGFLANWYRRALGRSSEDHLVRATEPQGVSQALLGDSAAFLEAVSLDDLRSLREDGVFEELRRQLSIDRGGLRAGSFRSAQEYEKAFLEGLARSLSHFGNQLEALPAEHRGRMRDCLKGLGLSVVLGALGLVLPPEPLLQLLAAGTGVTLGGNSIRDIIHLRRKHAESRATLSQTPMAILYDAWSKAGSTATQ